MRNKLIELIEQKEYVSVYANKNDTSKFIFGRLLEVDDIFVAIYMISPSGIYDGILIKELNEIIRIEIDSNYASTLLSITNEAELNKYKFNLDSDNIVFSLLKIANESGRVVSIELLNSDFDDVVGFVEVVEVDLCKIKQLDLQGREDGYSYVRLSDITQVSFDSNDEVNILQHYNCIYNS